MLIITFIFLYLPQALIIWPFLLPLGQKFKVQYLKRGLLVYLGYFFLILIFKGDILVDFGELIKYFTIKAFREAFFIHNVLKKHTCNLQALY
jgi:hypothetical protein